jgi:hypothetical protein
MRKYVGAILLLDEAEALGFVEPFHGACCGRHSVFLIDRLITALSKGR